MTASQAPANGEAEDGEHGDHDDGESCAATEPCPGCPRVHEAEARLTADGLVFEEVELLK